MVPSLGTDVVRLEAPLPCRGEYHKPAQWPDDRPVVAVAFAGGGARGLAHVGVIQVLEEEGIPVDLVTGTSMGGLVGGLWSLGYDGQQIDSLVSRIKWDQIFSDAPTHYELTGNARFQDVGTVLRVQLKDWEWHVPSGFIAGRRIEELLSDLTLGYHGEQDFLQLPRSFACVATDATSGQRVYMTQGELLFALRATMSIPSMFTPVRMDSLLLVDGGLVENSPVELARRLGADVVILAGLEPPLRKEAEIDNMFSIAEQTLTITTLEGEHRAARMADLAIMSSTGDVTTLDFHRYREVIHLGYLAADGYRERLRELRREVIGENKQSAFTRVGTRAQCITPEDPVHIGCLRLRCDVKMDSYRLQRMMDLYVGETRPLAEIKDHVHRLVSTGAFEKVTMQLVPGDTTSQGECASTMILDAKAKRGWNMEAFARYNEANRTMLGIRINWYSPFGPGSLDRMTILLGGQTLVHDESWIGNFRNTGLYLHPSASYMSHEVFIRDSDRSKLAGYRDRRYVLSLGAGWVVRNGARLEAGWYYDHFLAEPEVAYYYFTSAEITGRGLYTCFDLDLRDTREFPSRGSLIHARLNWAPRVLYENDYCQYKGNAAVYIALPDPWFHCSDRKCHTETVEPVQSRPLTPIPMGQQGGDITIELTTNFALPISTERSHRQIEPIGGPTVPGLFREEYWLTKYVTGSIGPRIWLNSFISVKPVFAFSHLAQSEIQPLPEGSFSSWGLEVAGRSLLGPISFLLSQRRSESLLLTVEIGYQ